MSQAFTLLEMAAKARTAEAKGERDARLSRKTSIRRSGAPSGLPLAKPVSLRIGIAMALSWHGMVVESFREFRRRQPDAELVLHHLLSIHQVEAVLSGRLEAGFAATITPWGKDLAHWEFRTEFYLQRPEAIP